MSRSCAFWTVENPTARAWRDPGVASAQAGSFSTSPSLEETDSFQIILDTFHDGQNGFVFGTNPAGVEYDGQVTNEGQGSGRSGGFVMRSGRGGQQRGSGGGFNLNWDGVWEVDAQISDIGWTAEVAIPFRTLRYPSGEAQPWGMNFQRNIRSRNEQSYWAPLPRQFDLNRLSLAGELHGLAVPQQRNLKLTPFAVGHWRGAGGNRRPDFGADLKYSITPGLTLAAAVGSLTLTLTGAACVRASPSPARRRAPGRARRPRPGRGR